MPHRLYCRRPTRLRSLPLARVTPRYATLRLVMPLAGTLALSRRAGLLQPSGLSLSRQPYLFPTHRSQEGGSVLRPW